MKNYLTFSLSMLLISPCAKKPGAAIELPEGTFPMTGTAKMTIRGQGIGKTVLSYKGQETGAAGIQATAGHFTLEGLTVQDTKGDGVKVNDGGAQSPFKEASHSRPTFSARRGGNSRGRAA